MKLSRIFTYKFTQKMGIMAYLSAPLLVKYFFTLCSRADSLLNTRSAPTVHFFLHLKYSQHKNEILLFCSWKSLMELQTNMLITCSGLSEIPTEGLVLRISHRQSASACSRTSSSIQNYPEIITNPSWFLYILKIYFISIWVKIFSSFVHDKGTVL